MSTMISGSLRHHGSPLSGQPPSGRKVGFQLFQICLDQIFKILLDQIFEIYLDQKSGIYLDQILIEILLDQTRFYDRVVITKITSNTTTPGASLATRRLTAR